VINQPLENIVPDTRHAFQGKPRQRFRRWIAWHIDFRRRLFFFTYLPCEQDGTCHVYGRVGSHKYPDNHRKCKVMDNSASQNKQCTQHGQGGSRGQDGTGQGLINASVNDEFKRIFMVFSDVFADAVENDDGVI